MDARQFVAEFGHIAHAPGGVARLREMIYQLAITASLTPRSNEGSDVSTLLAEIETTRQRLIREKNYKRMLELEGESIKIPTAIELPATWCWSRLLDIGEINPRNDIEDEVSAAFLPMSGIPQLHRGSVVSNISKWHEIKKGYTHFACNDVVLAKITPCFENGKAAVIRNLPENSSFGAGTTELHVFRPIHPGVLPDYVYLFLRSPLFTVEGERNMTGTAGQKRLPTEYFATRAFPLPPTEEQTRIVAKVDELMALCDKLEAQQQERRTLQNALRQATLNAVAAAASPHELHTTWTRLAGNFGQLFQAPEDVDEFSAELHNMAVCGLLELPSPSQPNVEDIKTSCETLRTRYMADGILRRQKIVGVADSEVSYPEHWAVVPFDEVAIVIGGVTKGRDLRGREVVTCPYLAVANVQRGYFSLQHLKTIQIARSELEKYLVEKGDLLITEGGDWDKVGRTAIWQGEIKDCLHQNHVFKARIPGKALLNEWVMLVFNSSIGRDYFAGASKQTTNLASINMSQLRSFPLPIPPFEEQKSILDKLNKLIELCSIWRKQLKKKQEVAALLSAAAVASFTGIIIEQEEEPMKTPQTELIAPLRLGQTPDIKAQAPLATILARHSGEMRANDLWRRFGGEIDAFYAQMKTEVAHGWILEPAVAEMREIRSPAGA